MALLANLLGLLQSIPPVTKAYTATIIAASALYGFAWMKGRAADAVYFMTLVPGTCLYTPWTFLTSGLFEGSILGFFFTVIFIPPSLRYLERLWGSLETIKFLVVTIVFTNIITFGANWLEYFILRKDMFLTMSYHGQMAVQIGVLVAFTQIIPEYHVQVMGVLRARVKTLPMAYLGLSTFMCIIGFQSPWILIQFGWFVSWIYLRFYKKHASEMGGTTYGDRSETFSLLSWFPPFVHKPLGLLGNTVHKLATRFRLIPTSHEDIEAGAYQSVPGGARAEAERRRALALQALDQRVANTSSPALGASTRSQNASQNNTSSASGGSPPRGGVETADIADSKGGKPT